MAVVIPRRVAQLFSRSPPSIPVPRGVCWLRPGATPQMRAGARIPHSLTKQLTRQSWILITEVVFVVYLGTVDAKYPKDW